MSTEFNAAFFVRSRIRYHQRPRTLFKMLRNSAGNEPRAHGVHVPIPRRFLRTLRQGSRGRTRLYRHHHLLNVGATNFSDEMFAKEGLDAAYVRQEEERVTRAWRRLQEIPHLGIPITEYPLPEVLAAWRKLK